MKDLYLQKFGLALKKDLKNESGWDMICKEMQDPYPKMEERICTMKKFFVIFAMALMLFATSCGNRQAETEVAVDSTAVEVVDTTIDEPVLVDTVTVDTSAGAVAE